MENSKKFNLILALILICAVCLTVIGFVVIYLTKNRTQEIFDACLSSDKGYIDYAKEVYLDTETYPDMAEMGLFWTKWDEETKTIIQVPADSEEGAALVNPNKPTLINVHGVLLDGYEKQEKFRLNTKIANPEEFDIDANYVYLNYIWLREGWNVANYHYNRFASEINPSLIEAKYGQTKAAGRALSPCRRLIQRQWRNGIQPCRAFCGGIHKSHEAASFKHGQ